MADAELAIIPSLTPSLATVAVGASRQAPATSARPGSRKQYNAAMKWVRRLHLYAGLLLTPWVFLYGITAFLFNHPNAFPDQEVRSIGAEETARTSLADFPRAGDLAARVVAALNARGEAEGDGPPYALVRPDEAAYTSDLIAQAKGGGRQHNVRLDLGSGRGTVRTSAVPPAPEPKAPRERAPFAGREPLEVADPPGNRIEEGVPAVLAGLGLAADEVTVRTPPELAFYLEGEDGKTWRATYHLKTGAVAGRPADVPAGEPGPGMSARRLLLRLHTAHGYSDGADARWGWALAVDAMAFAMVGWAISGLLMWWQMKNVRSIGAVMLGLSAVLATAATVGMTAHMRATAVAREPVPGPGPSKAGEPGSAAPEGSGRGRDRGAAPAGPPARHGRSG